MSIKRLNNSAGSLMAFATEREGALVAACADEPGAAFLLRPGISGLLPGGQVIHRLGRGIYADRIGDVVVHALGHVIFAIISMALAIC